MKKYFVSSIRKWVSPSSRNEFGEKVAWLRELLSQASFWNWVVIRFAFRAGSPFEVLYIGRKTRRDWAMSLLNVMHDVDNGSSEIFGSDRRVVVTEIPFPGAMRVPALLNSVVPLGRPIEEITSNFHSQLRRDLQKNRMRYHLRQVLDSAEIEHVDREMLRPYATARHGISANQTTLAEVKRMAQSYGRLDLLLCGNEVVGCQLGHVITRGGKRYWNTNRCGYPEAVFSDPRQLRDSNSINIHLALEWAIENGFDYYDIGVSLARPGDGLLEWKRRRGGELCKMGGSRFFYIRLPKVGAAQFLWDAPLFEVEQDLVMLHLGLPKGLGDEEVASRYREMGFRGLIKVYLHCAEQPGENILDMLRSLYVHQKFPPVLEVVISS